jgi:hypothetical protein
LFLYSAEYGRLFLYTLQNMGSRPVHCRIWKVVPVHCAECGELLFQHTVQYA